MRFCILIVFISLCLSSILTMVFPILFSNDLTGFSRLHYIDQKFLNKPNYDNSKLINCSDYINIVDLNNTNKNNIINLKFRTSIKNCFKYIKIYKNKNNTDLHSISD